MQLLIAVGLACTALAIPMASFLRWSLVALAMTAVATGCGSDEADQPSPTRTIAFLRAVPNASSSEPILLRELQANGYDQGRHLATQGRIGGPDHTVTRQLSCTKNSIWLNRPSANGLASDCV